MNPKSLIQLQETLPVEQIRTQEAIETWKVMRDGAATHDQSIQSKYIYIYIYILNLLTLSIYRY